MEANLTWNNLGGLGPEQASSVCSLQQLGNNTCPPTMYFSHIGYYNSENYSGWVDMEIRNVTEYIAYTNRYNGKSAKTNFGMINLADKKDPDTKVYDAEPNGHKYNLDKGTGSNCPAANAGLGEPDYTNSVDLVFDYYKSPPSEPFDGERQPISLTYVQMSYFDFDSGADGAQGKGKECVSINGDLAEYVIHQNTELRKDSGVWEPNVGADGRDTGKYGLCPADGERYDGYDEGYDWYDGHLTGDYDGDWKGDTLIDRSDAGDVMRARGCNRRFCSSLKGDNKDNPDGYDDTTNTSSPKYESVNKRLVSFNFNDVTSVALTLSVRCGIDTGRNFAFSGRKELLPVCPLPPPSPPPPSPPPPIPPPPPPSQDLSLN